MARAVLILGLIAAAAVLYWRQPLGTAAAFIRDVGPTRARIADFEPDSSATLSRDDGIRLRADWYSPTEPPRGAVLLLHGNTPIGQRLPLYRALGRRLSERGYLVLAPDFAGFGRSGDPFESGDTAALDPALDVRTAVNVLAQAGAPGRLAVIAHSGGAAGALPVALDDPRIGALVLFGPPRRTTARMRDPADRDYFYTRADRTHRQVYGHGLPPWYTPEMWESQVAEGGALASLQVGLERYLPELSEPGHTPLLLIDNAREDPLDLEYMDRFVEKVAPPVDHVRVPASDHYLNTRRLTPRWIGYDASALDATVAAIDAWLSRWAGRPASSAPAGKPEGAPPAGVAPEAGG